MQHLSARLPSATLHHARCRASALVRASVDAKTSFWIQRQYRLGSAQPKTAYTRQAPLPGHSSSRHGGSVMARGSGHPAAAAAKPLITVRPVTTPEQLQDFKSMTASYLEWLGEDLGFQGIERELACLPGSYAVEAGGCMLLAYESICGSAADTANDCDGSSGTGSGGSNSSEVCVGAVALRRLAGHTTVPAGGQVAGAPLERVCEMKRLFVLPGHHGLGVGAALCRALLVEAAALGYEVMVLDTLERLSGANRLYAALGFAQAERYNDCPLPGVMYWARRLGGNDGGSD